MDQYDVTIVGGGPVGLFAAALAGLHGLRAKIIESLPYLGGQLTALYPEKRVYDVAGFPAALAGDIARELESQAMRFKTDVRLNETVAEMQPLPQGGFRLVSDRGVHDTRTVLIAAGIGAFSPRRLPAAGAERYEGTGVHYVPAAMEAFRGKTVVVVGGGDTAVDWTREIAEYAERVLLVHRRDTFRALQGALQEIREMSNVELMTPYEIEEVGGEGAVEWVRLRHVTSHESLQVDADAVVSGLGFHAQLGALKGWGVAFQGNAIPVETSAMKTNMPGVFAVGDIVAYPGRVKLLALGFGEVGIAMAQIRAYLHPELEAGLPHSTQVAVREAVQ